MRAIALMIVALGQAGVIESGRAVVAERPLASMVRIPAGSFAMGLTEEARRGAVSLCKDELGTRADKVCDGDLFDREWPGKNVWLSAFAIDRVEVTVGAYRACVQAGACSPQPLM